MDSLIIPSPIFSQVRELKALLTLIELYLKNTLLMAETIYAIQVNPIIQGKGSFRSLFILLLVK